MTMSTLRPPTPRRSRRWSAQWSVLSRTVGTAAGSALALALLTCGCVFAALAGPALSLHTRTQALHQTLAQYPSTTKTVQVARQPGPTSPRRCRTLTGAQAGQGLDSGALPAVDRGHRAAAWRRRRSRSRAAPGPR